MESLWTITVGAFRSGRGLPTLPTLFAWHRLTNVPALRRSDKQGLRGSGPTWPRRGAVSALRGRIRNVGKTIHAPGLDRRASNPKPNLDIPDRSCRIIGTLLSWILERIKACPTANLSGLQDWLGGRGVATSSGRAFRAGGPAKAGFHRRGLDEDQPVAQARLGPQGPKGARLGPLRPLGNLHIHGRSEA